MSIEDRHTAAAREPRAASPERLQARQAELSDSLSRHFHLSLANFLVKRKMRPRRTAVEDASRTFAADLRAPLAGLVKGLLALSPPGAANPREAQCRDIPAEELAKLSDRFLTDLAALDRERRQAYMVVVNAPPLPGRELELAAKAFVDQIAILISFFTEAALDLMGLTCLDQELRQNAEPEELAPDVYKVHDLVGRILFLPLERYLEIVDFDPKIHQGKKIFPRCFCASLLDAFRPLVIGTEKYRVLNNALTTGISKLLGEGAPITNKNCMAFLHGEKTYKHIMSLTLHILNVYQDEKLREQLLKRINDNMFSRFSDPPLEFNERFCSLLFKSWARFIFDETPDFTNMKKAEAILRFHIPEMFKPKEETWVK